MKNAFGTADTEALQKAGLTSEEFIRRIVKQFEKLPAVTGGAQNAFENFADAVKSALLPLGQSLLSVLLPVVEKATSIIEYLGEAFASLPVGVKAALAAVAGLAAVIGPVLVAIGALAGALATIGGGIAAIGGLSAIGAALSGLLPIVGGVAAALAGLAVIVAALAAAWATNFAGIRDKTYEIWNTVVGFLKNVWAEIQGIWERVLPTLQSLTQKALDMIRGFWQRHGEQIVSILQGAFDI